MVSAAVVLSHSSYVLQGSPRSNTVVIRRMNFDLVGEISSISRSRRYWLLGAFSQHDDV
jgi:hypothetical protein